MKKYPSTSALAAVSIACILILAACSSAPTLRYITISPQTSNIAVTSTQQFSALAYYSDGTVKDGSSVVSWSSSNPAVATIDAFGVATGVSVGTVTITGTAAGTAGATATLNVSLLTHIVVAPPTATVPNGATQAYTATGTFTNPDGSTSTTDVTSLATWTSSDDTIATIDNTGLATAMAATGTATITAKLYGVSGTATLTGAPPVPASLEITPDAPSVQVGGAVNFTVKEVLTDGSTQTPTGTVTWASADTTIATLLGTGASTFVASGIAVGSSDITASESGLTDGTTTLTVVTGVSNFAYVSNTGGDLQYFQVSASGATPLTNSQTVTVSGTPGVLHAVVHPAGGLLYVVDSSNVLHVFTIDPATGAPTESAASAIAGGGGLNHAVIDPYGRFIYVSDDFSNTIFGFTIDQANNGALTNIAGTGALTTANLNEPEDLLIDPTGTYLYVTNLGGDDVSAYKINSDGTLSPLSTPTYATGSTPLFEAFDPAAKHLFVANSGGPTVSVFPINSDGTLGTPVTETITGASFVSNLAIPPSGSFIYVLDQGPAVSSTGTVYAYTLSDGVIGTTAIGSMATGVGPAGMAIDATGALLTVNNFGIDPGTISLFQLDGTTGALSQSSLTSPTVPAGNATWWTTFYNAAAAPSAAKKGKKAAK